MIYLVTTYYPPESNPPAKRMSHLAHLLVDRYGVQDIRVVTGRPNYPHGTLPRDFRWRFFKRTVGRWGEHIDHTYEYAAPFRGKTRKALSQLSHAASVFLYFLFKRLRRGDLVFITSGPIFTVFGLFLLSFVRPRLKYILDVRDLWPQVPAGMGYMDENSLSYRVMKFLSDCAHRRAVCSVGNVEGIRDYIRTVAPERETFLVHNPVDMSLFSPMTPERKEKFRAEHADLYPPGKTSLVFAGTQNVVMNLMVLLKALNILQEQRRDFSVILIGYGEETERLVKFAEENGLKGSLVHFLPHMKREQLVEYLGAADFCYSSTRPKDIYKMVVPTKMCEYLALNQFVVAVHDCPFADQVSAAGNAVVSPPGDSEALARTLSHVFDHRDELRANITSRRFIQQCFSVEKFREKMDGIFEKYYANGS